MARVLVTGSSGYAGACIAAVLRRAGHNVSGLTTRLEKIVPASFDIDFLVHAAGARPHRPPEEYDISNHLGTCRLLAGLSRHTSVILLSSRGAYSPTFNEYLHESDPADAHDAYGRSRRLAEQALTSSGHTWIVFRLSAIYGWGEGQPGVSFLSNATRALLRGDAVTVYEPDRNHDYLHVQTLGELIMRLIDARHGWNEIYNLAGPPVSHHKIMACLASAVSRRTGRPAPLRYAPGPSSRAAILDYGKFTSTFGPTGQPDYPCAIEELAAKCSLNFSATLNR